MNYNTHTHTQRNRLFSIFLLFFTLTFFTSCEKDIREDVNTDNASASRMSNKALMSTSYTITTSQSFDNVPNALSNLDLANLNPSTEKQHVSLDLFEDGSINATIEKLGFKNKVAVLHKALPNDVPPIVKTVIRGGQATFYDTNGKEVGKRQIQIENKIAIVKKIKSLKDKFSIDDINATVASFQGQRFIDNLEEFIRTAPTNNITVSNEGNGLLKLKFPPSENGNVAIILVDKDKNRMMGNEIYNAKNELLQRVLFAYNTGEVKSIKAIRTTQPFILPSGKKVNSRTLSHIENFKFNLNI